MLDALIIGSASYQLYFIPALVILYALFPFFVKNNALLSKVVLAMVFIGEAILLLYLYYNNTSLPIFHPLEDAIYNFLPFFVGIYLGVKNIDIKKTFRKFFPFSIILTAALAVFVFAESTFMYEKTDNIFFLRNQWRISVMLYGILAGGFFYYIYEKYLKNFGAPLSYLSRFSFGIFFVHVAVLQLLIRHFVDLYDLNNIMWFALTFLLTITISLAFSIVVSKIKLADRILGVRG